MRAKVGIVVPLVLLLAAACTGTGSEGSSVTGGQPAERTGSAAVPPETLLLGTDHGPTAVRVPDGSVVFDSRGGVASPDGSMVFSTTSDGGRTRLEGRVASTGEVVDRARVQGRLEVRVVSSDGSAVALTVPLPRRWDPRVPFPRARTRIVVADPSGLLRPHTYDLRGNFEPEAFSSDDSRLFLIQHLPAEAPAVYRVMVLDLLSGRVDPVFGPYKIPPEKMPGTRLEQVYAPSGSQLYTLYTSDRPGYAPHRAPVAKNATVSFIHVLDLQQGWAHCVALPKAFWHQPASHESIAPSPDGRRLYIVDAVRGLVAVMDTGSLDIVRTTPIELGTAAATHTAAQVAPDGSALFVAVADGSTSLIRAIDTTTFDVERGWSMPAAVSGFGVSADGLRLQLALGERVRIVDAGTGRELEVVPFTSTAPIVAVTPLPT